ncbi:hypothetical protein T492DRAFT_902707, partial [Pavlovales sp. CCMP2436]
MPPAPPPPLPPPPPPAVLSPPASMPLGVAAGSLAGLAAVMAATCSAAAAGMATTAAAPAGVLGAGAGGTPPTPPAPVPASPPRPPVPLPALKLQPVPTCALICEGVHVALLGRALQGALMRWSLCWAARGAAAAVSACPAPGAAASPLQPGGGLLGWLTWPEILRCVLAHLLETDDVGGCEGRRIMVASAVGALRDGGEYGSLSVAQRVACAAALCDLLCADAEGVRAAVDASHRAKTGTQPKGPKPKLPLVLVDARDEAEGAPGPARMPNRTRPQYLGSDYRGLHAFDVGSDSFSVYLLPLSAFPPQGPLPFAKPLSEAHKFPPGGLWRCPLRHAACPPSHTAQQWLREMEGSRLVGEGKLRSQLGKWVREMGPDAEAAPAAHAHALMLESLLGALGNLVDVHVARRPVPAMQGAVQPPQLQPQQQQQLQPPQPPQPLQQQQPLQPPQGEAPQAGVLPPQAPSYSLVELAKRAHAIATRFRDPAVAIDLDADNDADADAAVAVAMGGTRAVGADAEADWRLGACTALLREVLGSLPDSALLLLAPPAHTAQQQLLLGAPAAAAPSLPVQPDGDVVMGEGGALA